MENNELSSLNLDAINMLKENKEISEFTYLLLQRALSVTCLSPSSSGVSYTPSYMLLPNDDGRRILAIFLSTLTVRFFNHSRNACRNLIKIVCSNLKMNFVCVDYLLNITLRSKTPKNIAEAVPGFAKNYGNFFKRTSGSSYITMFYQRLAPLKIDKNPYLIIRNNTTQTIDEFNTIVPNIMIKNMCNAIIGYALTELLDFYLQNNAIDRNTVMTLPMLKKLIPVYFKSDQEFWLGINQIILDNSNTVKLNLNNFKMHAGNHIKIVNANRHPLFENITKITSSFLKINNYSKIKLEPITDKYKIYCSEQIAAFFQILYYEIIMPCCPLISYEKLYLELAEFFKKNNVMVKIHDNRPKISQEISTIDLINKPAVYVKTYQFQFQDQTINFPPNQLLDLEHLFNFQLYFGDGNSRGNV